MLEMTGGVHRLDQWPRPMINIYVAGDVLVDAGTRGARRRVFSQIGDSDLSALALTHVHPDHQGVAADVCDMRGIPLACHAYDVDAMEGRQPIVDNGPGSLTNRLATRVWAGPSRTVDTVLAEGDRVGDLEVVHAPGHTRGHVIYFRRSDRTAICGDVVRNVSYLTGRAGLREPPVQFTPDPAENRRSIRKLAELDPTLILPGHGPAIEDMTAFRRFVETLPDD